MMSALRHYYPIDSAGLPGADDLPAFWPSLAILDFYPCALYAFRGYSGEEYCFLSVGEISHFTIVGKSEMIRGQAGSRE